MDDGVNAEDKKVEKMGASSTLNASRLTELQERKQTIEETLAKRNLELRQLCIQEAELTGIMPTEIPLEPGESLPTFRRRVGTSFQIPQNLINNLSSEEESITSLELNMQLQANMAEAALSLANEPNISKTIRRQHMAEYQRHKQEYSTLEEKLTFFKKHGPISQLSPVPAQNAHHKQKKKPRPIEEDDSVSMNVNIQQSEPFGKPQFRHSIRSLQYSLISDNNSDNRHSPSHKKLSYRSSEGSPRIEAPITLIRSEDPLTSGIFSLSLNGYKTYMDRKENNGSSRNYSVQFIHSHSNPNLHQQGQNIQYAQMTTQTLPHSTHRYPHSPNFHHSVYGYSNVGYPQYSTNYHSPDYNKYPIPNNHQLSNNPVHILSRQLYNSNLNNNVSHNQKSYYPSHTVHGQTTYKQYTNVEQPYRTLNPHQLQPHQQYEHDYMTSGLGGFWKRSESGNMVWCASLPSDSWQRGKRFGSLDRRKNKRLNKRTSPSIDQKSATISTTSAYPESVRRGPAKSEQIIHRSRQDNRQLVRTQSLGSVGAQTVDSVWPSDDNSSCGSDTHSINDVSVAARKQKQKDWIETSLDGPTPLTPMQSHSAMSSTTPSISPEEKYIETPPLTLHSPQTPKPTFEIPAESNPTPSPIVQEPNMELFNNKIPKNCTIIQAGHCKPYHEETKPFEMSDFYKYSTKFKKSPAKQSNETRVTPVGSPSISQMASPTAVHRNLNKHVEDDTATVTQKVVYQPLQPMKCQSIGPTTNYDRNVENIGSPESINTSLNLSQLTSNVAENFSAEMNAWYLNHEQTDNSTRSSSNSRSTATLV